MSKSLDGQYAKDILFALAKKLGYNKVVRTNRRYEKNYTLILVDKNYVPCGAIKIVNDNRKPREPHVIPFTFRSTKWLNIIKELEGKTISIWYQKDRKSFSCEFFIDSIEGLIITLQLEGYLPA